MSPESTDYRLYIEEKFEGLGKLINAHFINLDERLEKIEVQVTKTNGRVTDLEKQEILHIVNCPVMPEVLKIKEDIEDVTFFSRHPKLGVGIIGVFVLIFIGSAIMFYDGLKSNLKQTKANTELIIKNDSTLKTMQ